MNYVPLLTVLVFVLFDIVTGIVKGYSSGTMSSSIMREGLWHKCGTIILELFALFCSVTPKFIDGFPNEFSTVYIAMTIYICAMETISIIENISVINPDLNIDKIFGLFGSDKKS